ncbi:unnamed protein product [Boreogadus saida]
MKETVRVNMLAPCQLLTPHCCLLTPHCCLLTPHCCLLTPHCRLLTPHCRLLTATSSPLTAASSPLTAASSPLTAASSPLTAASSPLTAASSPLTAASSPLTATSLTLPSRHSSLLSPLSSPLTQEDQASTTSITPSHWTSTCSDSMRCALSPSEAQPTPSSQRRPLNRRWEDRVEDPGFKAMAVMGKNLCYVLARVSRSISVRGGLSSCPGRSAGPPLSPEHLSCPGSLSMEFLYELLPNTTIRRHEGPKLVRNVSGGFRARGADTRGSSGAAILRRRACLRSARGILR